ncbi:MAG: TraR/DksA family transcriptional regulator [Cypionkella sp.]
MKSIAVRKAQLEARRKDLLGRIDGIKDELESHQEKDWEEIAIQREGDEVLEGMGLEAQSELRAIAAALARVASGDYGTCLKCGTRIDEARLDVLPYTPFCKECAE